MQAVLFVSKEKIEGCRQWENGMKKLHQTII